MAKYQLKLEVTVKDQPDQAPTLEELEKAIDASLGAELDIALGGIHKVKAYDSERTDE